MIMLVTQFVIFVAIKEVYSIAIKNRGQMIKTIIGMNVKFAATKKILQTMNLIMLAIQHVMYADMLEA